MSQKISVLLVSLDFNSSDLVVFTIYFEKNGCNITCVLLIKRKRKHNFVISFQTMQYFDHLRNSCDAWKLCLTDFSERADR